MPTSTLIKLIAPIDATPSYNGYEFQYSIALLEVLKLMNDPSNSCESIDGYKLELEGAEDFSIVNGETYISLHQVKKTKNIGSSNDKYCFIVSLFQYGTVKGFYHIQMGAKMPSDFVACAICTIRERLSQIDYLISEKKDIETSINTESDKKKATIEILIAKLDNQRKYTYDDIEASKDTSSKKKEKITHGTKGSLKNILAFQMKFNKKDVWSHENVFEKLEKIKKEFENIESWLHTDEENLVPHLDTKFLVEDSSKYDSVLEVREAITQEVKGFLEKNNTPASSKESLEVVVSILIFKINEIVTSESQKEEDKRENCRIDLKTIREWIIHNLGLSVDTFEYQLVNFYNIILKRTRDKISNEHGGGSCPNEFDECCNLCEQFSNIERMTLKQFAVFAQNLLMRIPMPGKGNEIPTSEDIDEYLTRRLDSVRGLKVSDDNILQFFSKEKSYMWTLQSSYYIDDFNLKVMELYKNAGDFAPLLYEADCLVTRIKKKSIFSFDRISFDRFNKEDDVDKERMGILLETKVNNFLSSTEIELIGHDEAEDIANGN